METFADRVTLLQTESARIKQYLHTLPPDAWDRPAPVRSGRCGMWWGTLWGELRATRILWPVGYKGTMPPRRGAAGRHGHCHGRSGADGPAQHCRTGAAGRAAARGV